MPEVALTLPPVAVIVPAYGVAPMLGEALASLRAQAMPDWQCAVIDDRARALAASAVAPFPAVPRIHSTCLDKIAARALI
jgi:cellulose synthase/poly-beta-1,6-N-acetylglucosamine synthase-like glycosyltransferase